MALESITIRPALAPFLDIDRLQNDMHQVLAQAAAIADLIGLARHDELADDTISNAAWAMRDLLSSALKTLYRRTDGSDGDA